MNWAALGNRLWQWASWLEASRFQAGLKNVRQEQEKRLIQLLAQQAETAFGIRHQLAQVDSYQRFCQQVPISDYESLLPYLSQPGGLSPHPINLWEPTGGSTGGSKWIPWNGPLQSEFRRAVAVWIWNLFRHDPHLRNGRAYWQLTPKTECGRPPWATDEKSGFAGDGEYLGALGRLLERTVLLTVDGGPSFWHRSVSRLKATTDLRLISCWSPSFLVTLQERFLEFEGRWEPQAWWPNLQLISCWSDGPSSTYLPRLQQMFPGVALQPKGLLATEAVTTIPIGSRHPLAYRSHFFEFLDDSGVVIPAWELELGQEATVLVTTGAGLTRYNTGDRVRVNDFLEDLPCLGFLGRRGMSDQRGEKLAWSFLERLLQPLTGFVMLAFEKDSYVLFFDHSQNAETRRTQVALLENQLLQNYSYRDCRELGQLEALRGYQIRGDALSAYQSISVRMLGAREGHVKLRAFHSDSGWSEAFQGYFLTEKEEP